VAAKVAALNAQLASAEVEVAPAQLGSLAETCACLGQEGGEQPPGFGELGAELRQLGRRPGAGAPLLCWRLGDDQAHAGGRIRRYQPVVTGGGKECFDGRECEPHRVAGWGFLRALGDLGGDVAHVFAHVGRRDFAEPLLAEVRDRVALELAAVAVARRRAQPARGPAGIAVEPGAGVSVEALGRSGGLAPAGVGLQLLAASFGGAQRRRGGPALTAGPQAIAKGDGVAVPVEAGVPVDRLVAGAHVVAHRARGL
jgi:hypothetical protein